MLTTCDVEILPNVPTFSAAWLRTKDELAYLRFTVGGKSLAIERPHLKQPVSILSSLSTNDMEDSSKMYVSSCHYSDLQAARLKEHPRGLRYAYLFATCDERSPYPGGHTRPLPILSQEHLQLKQSMGHASREFSIASSICSPRMPLLLHAHR